MLEVYKKLFKNHNTNARQVALQTGLPLQTVVHSFDRELDSWTTKVTVRVAAALNMSVDELYHVVYNDDQQKLDAEAQRIVKLTKDTLKSYGFETSNGKQTSVDYFKENRLTTFDQRFLGPKGVLIWHSLIDLIQAPTEQQALLKARDLSDAEIKDIVRASVVAKCKQMIDENWASRAMQDWDTEHVPTVALAQLGYDLFKVNEQLKEFVKLNDDNENVPLDKLLTPTKFDFVYQSHMSRILIKLGEHIYYLNDQGRAATMTHNQTRLAGRTVQQAIKEDIDLIDDDRDRSVWHKAKPELALHLF